MDYKQIAAELQVTKGLIDTIGSVPFDYSVKEILTTLANQNQILLTDLMTRKFIDEAKRVIYDAAPEFVTNVVDFRRSTTIVLVVTVDKTTHTEVNGAQSTFRYELLDELSDQINSLNNVYPLSAIRFEIHQA